MRENLILEVTLHWRRKVEEEFVRFILWLNPAAVSVVDCHWREPGHCMTRWFLEVER